MTGSEYGANEGEVLYDDLAWDYAMQEETIEEARQRMTEEERAADFAFDPFAEEAG